MTTFKHIFLALVLTILGAVSLPAAAVECQMQSGGQMACSDGNVYQVQTKPSWVPETPAAMAEGAPSYREWPIFKLKSGQMTETELKAITQDSVGFIMAALGTLILLRASRQKSINMEKTGNAQKLTLPIFLTKAFAALLMVAGYTIILTPRL